MTNCSAPTVDAVRLEAVALGLCTEVGLRYSATLTTCLTEQQARAELLACLLSSQVRAASASAWTEAFRQDGLLEDLWWVRSRAGAFPGRVRALLAGERRASTQLGRYRFFRVRAAQIAATRDQLAMQPLLARLHGSPREMRRRLVKDIPGLGPKQASMFLRNVGVTCDLAIIDRHTARFLALQGIMAPDHTLPSTVHAYERLEQTFSAYAEMHAVSPGVLDVAVWATMVAARRPLA